MTVKLSKDGPFTWLGVKGAAMVTARFASNFHVGARAGAKIDDELRVGYNDCFLK